MSSNNPPESNFSGDSNNFKTVSAPIMFVQSLQHQVNEHDISALIQSQKHMLARFEKTNEMLVNCNALMGARYVGASKELKKHIVLLVDLKKDLESIFRRIRFLKMKLSQQYSEAFKASNVFNVLDEEEEQDPKTTSLNEESEAIASSTADVASSSGSGGSPTSSPSTSDTG